MGTKTALHIFTLNFEQLSIILAVPLLLNFNKYTALGVSSFSVHHFYVSKYNRNLRRNKQKISAGKKTIEEKQTILLESIQHLS